VIDGRVDGVTSDDVRRLFALDGQSTNGSVQFVIGSSRTGSPKSPVQIDITQAAEHAAITAGSSVASSVTIDATNDTLSIRLDGASATDIKIAQGTYTAQELATQVETAINATSSLGGRAVSVGLSGGALTVRSESYGTTSEIAVSGGTALASLGFAGTESDFGVDVAGSFIVDGVTETAKGRGRLLVGDLENKNTADLQVRVSLSASQVQPGVDAELNVTRGIASSLDQVLGRVLDPTTGRMKTINDGFDDTIKTLQTAIDRQNDFFEKQQAKLIDEFTTLESTVGQLQQTAQYISAQLTSIGK
jgi:flagellar hook-associated protein 2